MCLLATITPLSIVRVARSVEIVIPGVLSILPLSLTGALIPSTVASVNEISTCVDFLAGPRTTTFFNEPLGPVIVTLSLHAYWPGCDKSLTLFNW